MPCLKKIATGLLLASVLSAAHAEYSDGLIKIGVLTDMSGLYADITGPGSLWAARKAVENFNPASHCTKVEVCPLH